MKFKSIIFLFLSTILLMGCDNEELNLKRPSRPSIDGIEVEKGMNLVGMVKNDSDEPVEGVVVSDGYSVTVTDAKGVYQMKTGDKSRFVFVSVPADFQIPMENGHPKIYQALPEKITNVERKDFSLKKQEKVTQFRLLAMADVQIGQDKELQWLRNDEMPEIVKYAETLKKDQPLYGISLGDLVWDNMPFFKEYATETARLNIPVFHVIGNHDHDRTVLGNDDGASHYFEANFGPTYYSYNIGEVHFVVLDDVDYAAGDNYAARITQNQLDWLEKDLAHVSKDKLIMLGVHIPILRRFNNSGVENRQALYDILEGYNVRIMSGHRHNNSTATINSKIEENNLGAVMGAFWNDPCNDGSPRGYAVYEINGNKIENWYYKGTKTDKDYQLKLYGLGESTLPYRQDGVIINVFNWHTSWTLNVYENEILKKTFGTSENLKNPFELDWLAYNLYFGDNLPVHRPSAEPEFNNDHMFYYKPTATTGITVKVEAQDPYGNTYTESIELK